MKTLLLQLLHFSLQIGTTNHGICANPNPIMPPYLTSPIRSNSNTSNCIQITLNLHIPHASSKRLSILQIGNILYINQSLSLCISVHPSKNSVHHIHTGITNRHVLMPSISKIQTIAIPGFFTFIIP